MREIIVFPGQKVVTASGDVAIVAFMRDGEVYVYGKDGVPTSVKICGDAWGGEHDQTIGLAA